jgi:hypothetical protein
MGGGNNVVALLLPSPLKIKLFIMEKKIMDLQSFVHRFSEVESMMYQIKEGDWEDDVSSKERKLLNEIIELSKYIAETYSKNEF